MGELPFRRKKVRAKLARKIYSVRIWDSKWKKKKNRESIWQFESGKRKYFRSHINLRKKSIPITAVFFPFFSYPFYCPYKK